MPRIASTKPASSPVNPHRTVVVSILTSRAVELGPNSESVGCFRMPLGMIGSGKEFRRTRTMDFPRRAREFSVEENT